LTPRRRTYPFASRHWIGERYRLVIERPLATGRAWLTFDRLRSAPSLGCGERKGTVHPGINTETHGDEIAQLLCTGGREKTCPKLPTIVASSQA
jgi:hypothetical protein